MSAIPRNDLGSPSRLGRLNPILEEYAEALGIPISPHAPANRLSPPRRDGGLHVHLFALPARPHESFLWPVSPSVDLPAVFSWALAPGTQRALAPGRCFSTGTVKHDPKGRAIAGMLGENMYVFYDLLGQPDPSVPVLLRKTLDLCLEGSTEWLSQATGRLLHHVEITVHRLSHTTTLRSLGSPNTSGECRGLSGGRPEASGVADEEELAGRMAASEENLKELFRRMMSQSRLLSNCRERLRRLQAAEQSQEAVARELDGLLAIPDVRSVDVLDHGLRVITAALETVAGGKRYRLGSFQVDIRFTGEVTIRNLTRPYGYYDHPHVWNGKPCLGNVGPSVLKLVSEFQWVAAIQLLLEYLKTVNPQGWYAPVHHWEEIPV